MMMMATTGGGPGGGAEVGGGPQPAQGKKGEADPFRLAFVYVFGKGSVGRSVGRVGWVWVRFRPDLRVYGHGRSSRATLRHTLTPD